MKIGFHEDHWWIIVNGVRAYRLSIPRDVTPEEARQHATNVLIYLAERAEIVHHLGNGREGTTEGQPARSECDAGSREFDEVQSLTSHVDRLANQLFGTLNQPASEGASKGGQHPVGRDPVPSPARESRSTKQEQAASVSDLDIVRVRLGAAVDNTRAELEFTDRAGRILLTGVGRVAGGWRMSINGPDFKRAHAKGGWNGTIGKGIYRDRVDCAGTLVTILRDVLNLSSPF